MTSSTVSFAPAEQRIVAFKHGSIALLQQFETLNVDGEWEPLDMTGYTDFELVIYDQSDPDNVLDTYTDGDGLTLDLPAGQVQIEVSDAVVDEYDWTSARYYYRCKDASGVAVGLSAGVFEITLRALTEVGQIEDL